MSRRSNILVSDIFQQGTTQTTEARARLRPTAALVTSNEPEVEVVGGRKVWKTLKACAVGIVKSVFFRFCSNTTAEVNHKSKVVCDSEESLSMLHSALPLHSQLFWSLLS